MNYSPTLVPKLINLQAQIQLEVVVGPERQMGPKKCQKTGRRIKLHLCAKPLFNKLMELALLSLFFAFLLACVADALNLLYIAYGLYKWFRRVRGPAATQATFL